MGRTVALVPLGLVRLGLVRRCCMVRSGMVHRFVRFSSLFQVGHHSELFTVRFFGMGFFSMRFFSVRFRSRYCSLFMVSR